ncbi:MAG TPA: rhomboid family intramembrane serine protease [bacterium]|nr:rhomboid family intramembrane serine protease [bacterium]
MSTRMVRSMYRPTARQPLPGDCPVTWALIIANGLTFLLDFIGSGSLESALVFYTGTVLQRPWTLLTYPLVAGGSIFWILLSAYILWLFGGSLERAWGSRQYAVFWALVAVTSALGLELGSTLTGRHVPLTGVGLPLASIVLVWATMNPSEVLLAYFVIPMQARWLGLIVLILTVFSFPFPLGIFALAGPAVAVWFLRWGRYGQLLHRGGRPRSRGARAREQDRLTVNPVVWFRRWRQRRRFRRLVRTLGPDPPDQTVH